MQGALAAVGLMALALAAGCSDEPEQTRGPVEVHEVRLIAPDTIELGVMSCHGDPELTQLSQDDERVRVEITSTVTDPGDACMDLFEVVLDAPLGERDLVDLTSGQTLQVRG
jgi:hypothetical protein